jgi:hypothetical protein
MRRVCQLLMFVSLLAPLLRSQEKRLWVLRETREMVEYDLKTFAAKEKVKVPPEALKSPVNFSVNRSGQMLFAPGVAQPISEEDAAAAHKVWFWNGHEVSELDQAVVHKVEVRGSNQVITESAPVPFLSADGTHLYWFNNHARRLNRDQIDLSTEITWEAWRTDLAGTGRQDVASEKLPDCKCATGVCEESCPLGLFWAPDAGVDKFFLMTQFIGGQTGSTYKSSSSYHEEGGKWVATPFPSALEDVLDASPSGDIVVEALPDSACCGWSNESNDQTLVLANGKSRTVFDELATYKNPDYDVSFSTSNARLSPGMDFVAMTVTSTAQADKPIQLAEDGQANPEESQRIRKALADLPAVVVKSMEDSPRQVTFVPHATLAGWISDKELLILEDHVLVVYNVGSGVRRKSTVKVDDAKRVFLR